MEVQLKKIKRFTRKRTSLSHKKKESPLRTSYGIVRLPKGTRLYHMSANPFCETPIKPILFTTLHPSEWYMEGTYISVFELQTEVILLFMVKTIHTLRVISALNDFLGIHSSNLAKQNYTRILQWIPSLEKEHLDGWFSSIENKSTVEFAILNRPSVLKLVECIPIRFNWNNSSYTDTMEIIPKQWGTTYPISSLQLPVKFILNSRFKSMIEAYKSQIDKEDPRGTVFSILLENAEISYFDAPIEKIQW